MAKTPKWLKQVNNVTFWISNPCEDPWMLYFELALPALGRVILAFLAFGLDDVIRGFFRPKGIYRRTRRRPARKGRIPKLGIPELGELIGSHLPGAEEAKGRGYTQGEKYLWVVDGVIQRALWYWMVYDVTTDFFIEWSAAIQDEAAGKNCVVCRMLREGGNFPFVGPNPVLAMPVEHLKYSHNVSNNAFGGVAANDLDYMVFVGATFRNDGGSDVSIAIGIGPEADPFRWGGSGFRTIKPGNEADLVLKADIPGGVTATWVMVRSGPQTWCIKNSATIMSVAKEAGPT